MQYFNYPLTAKCRLTCSKPKIKSSLRKTDYLPPRVASQGIVTMTPRFFTFVFLGCTLPNVRGEEDDWIDPYNMTHYDSTSKTMRNIPEVPKKADTEGIASRYLDEKESPEISECFQKLVNLQRAIEDVKHKTSVLKQHPEFISAQNSKLNQLLKSIEQLRIPHDDDFCHLPWLCIHLEEARRFISVTFHEVATHFTNFTSNVLSEPGVTRSLLPLGCVTILLLFVCCRKRRRGQLVLRAEREQEQENDQQNDDLEQEQAQEQEQEGERDNPDPRHQGQEAAPPVEDLGPEQVEERRASEPPEQGSDASGDECCDENYSITKLPVTETEPDAQHCT
ncbi:hypothetical protein COCON_G00061880 [Conger conger]|uniref:Chloride channel CLIC-like protein 1 n=1 Tax=Conger conger TaxID=82655 RepID=A0A9Q1I1V2_CONCO|nr:hypothetical protein COCON_G00061880 [Conger conger]